MAVSGRRPLVALHEGDGSRGAGSLLMMAVIAGVTATLLLMAPLVRALELRAQLRGAADAAALAAADTARGLSPGIPCTIAASVAAANGAFLTDCQADGVIVTVRVSDDVLGFAVSASATAGPPFMGK